MKTRKCKRIFMVFVYTLMATLLSASTVLATPITPVEPVAPIAPIAPIAPQLYTVIFDLTGGIRTGGGELTQHIPLDGSAIAPQVLRQNYDFAGWDSSYTNITQSITIKALWTPSSAVTPPAVVPPIAPAPTPVPPIAIVPPIVTPITPQIYTVTFNLNGGTRVGGGALTQAVPSGGSAVEPYAYRPNYVFTGWDTSFTNIGQNLTVSAYWAPANVTPVTPTVPPATAVQGNFINDKSTFMQLNHLPLIYYVNANVANFSDVEVNGNVLTSGTDYVATAGTTSGTTAIHLKASYMNNLTAGYHTLKVIFRDGYYSSAQFTVSGYTNTFIDVHTNDWFYDGVAAMNASELLLGVSNTQFDPYSQMTRGMVVTLLYRYAGQPSIAGFRNPFPDVTANQYYTNSAIWAAANGIVVGHDNGLFAPYELMTHEQFAAVLYRYQNMLGTVPIDILMDRTYSDFNQINLYARSAVNKLTMQGVFRDLPYDPANRFQPQAPVTRAKVATVMRLWIESVGW